MRANKESMKKKILKRIEVIEKVGALGITIIGFLTMIFIFLIINFSFFRTFGIILIVTSLVLIGLISYAIYYQFKGYPKEIYFKKFPKRKKIFYVINSIFIIILILFVVVSILSMKEKIPLESNDIPYTFSYNLGKVDIDGVKADINEGIIERGETYSISDYSITNIGFIDLDIGYKSIPSEIYIDGNNFIIEGMVIVDYKGERIYKSVDYHNKLTINLETGEATITNGSPDENEVIAEVFV